MTDDTAVTFSQDTWWTTADGLTHLIDDLDDRHRANIAGFLVKYAAAYHMMMRLRQLAAAYMMAGDYDGDAPDWDIPTHEEDMHEIRKEQMTGAHLAWVRGSVLFKRMIRDLPESSLPPGTLRSAAREEFV